MVEKLRDRDLPYTNAFPLPTNVRGAARESKFQETDSRAYLGSKTVQPMGGSSDRDILNREFQALAQEIDRVANTANFNGQTLLNGSSPLSDGTGTVQVDPSSDPANQITVSETDLTAESLEIENLDISNSSNSSQAIAALDNAAKQVNEARSSHGAIANRLQSAHNSAVDNRHNTTQALSRAEDLDYAKAVTDQIRESLLAQMNIEAQVNFYNIARNNLLALIQ